MSPFYHHPPHFRITCQQSHYLTLCPHECGRFLVPPAGATDHLAVGSRSPAVPKRLGSRVPHGTTSRSLLERSRQDVARRVVVSVQDQAAPRTDMGTHRQTLVDPPPTARTRFARVVRGDGDDRNALHLPVVFDPLAEACPAGVGDALGQVPILD